MMSAKSQSIQISVVIPVYNNTPWISRAIDSVLAQSRPPDEVIVIDDGSTDDTAKCVKEYGNPVILIEQPNAGAAAARNRGIEAATGNWIAFLDGDDEWLENRLAEQVKLIESNPELAWCTGNYYTCLLQESWRAPYIEPEKARTLMDHLDITKDYFAAYPAGLGGHTNTMLIRKDVLVEAGLFRVEQKRANDLDLWWRIAYRHPRIGFVVEPLAVYYLDIAGSITKPVPRGSLYTDLIERHLVLAGQAEAAGRFGPFISTMLKRWLRAMLFDSQKDDIRLLLQKFPYLLSPSYRIGMTALTQYPGVTAGFLRMISKIVRLFRLRRRVVIPPRRQG